MKRLAVLALACAVFAGCATSRNIAEEDVAQANFHADVNAMKSRMQEMRMRLEDLEARSGKGEGVSMDDMNARLTRLEEIVGRMAQALSIDVGQRALAAQAPPAQPSGADPYQAEARQQAAPASDNPAEAIYNMGMEAYSARNYERAVSLFSEMLKTYPTDRMAPSALFWQAEANFQLGDYARTALLCQDLIQKYPGSSMVPSAMLKQGLAFRRLGRDQAARIVLQDVVTRHPNSPEAKSAQMQLREIR